MQITKVQNHQIMGVYQPTTLDQQKSSVDFLLTGVSPNFIKWNNTGETQKVTANQLAKLQNTFTWKTDF